MAQFVDPAALGTVAGEIQRRMREGEIPGACAAVYVKDQLVYETSVGIANEQGEPLARDSIFHMASMTKPITGVAVMQQIEAGKLSVDDPISRWFPQFAKMEVAEYADKVRKVITGTHPSPREITVRDCLTHSSGIGLGAAYDAAKNEARLFAGETVSDVAPRLAAIPLQYDPGTECSYSPIAAPDILAAIVEQISGEKWENYVQKHIFEPLGMADTGFCIPESKRARRVQAFAKKDGKCVPAKITDSEFYNDIPYLISGGAGLNSTLADYSRFARALCRGGELDGARILAPESVETLRTPHLTRACRGVSDTFNWSFLLYVRTAKAGRQVLPAGSYGWSGAFGTHFFVAPELSLCAVFLANTTTSGGAGAITASDFERAVMSAVRDC